MYTTFSEVGLQSKFMIFFIGEGVILMASFNLLCSFLISCILLFSCYLLLLLRVIILVVVIIGAFAKLRFRLIPGFIHSGFAFLEVPNMQAFTPYSSLHFHVCFSFQNRALFFWQPSLLLFFVWKV